MWDILLIFLLSFGILDVSSSISSMLVSLDLSWIPMSLKVLENLPHNIRKYLFLDSGDKPRGSGLGTVSTYISFNGDTDWLILAFPLEAAGVVIILQDVQVKAPSYLWNLSCSILVLSFTFLLCLVCDPLVLFLGSKSATSRAFGCKDDMGILILGSSLIPKCM